jgi:hypothetical protein
MVLLESTLCVLSGVLMIAGDSPKAVVHPLIFLSDAFSR